MGRGKATTCDGSRVPVDGKVVGGAMGVETNVGTVEELVVDVVTLAARAVDFTLCVEAVRGVTGTWTGIAAAAAACSNCSNCKTNLCQSNIATRK